MRYLLIVIFCATAVGSLAQNKPTTAALQTKYLPKQLKGLYIGMDKAELLKQRPSTTETDVLGYPEEKFGQGDVKRITYQLDTDNNTLYEFIVEYRNEATAKAVAKQLYKKPNDATKEFPLAWKIKLSEDLTLKCWIFRNKVCIADARQF